MSVIGHGVDIVAVPRVRRLLDRHGDRFLCRCFTPGERAYAAGRRRQPEHLAARFAAKEAVLKALGTGMAAGIAWTDIEVATEASGRPAIALAGEAARMAHARGIRRWSLSLSHAGDYAIASVLAHSDEPEKPG